MIYHYCILRHRLNANPEYADGLLDALLWPANEYPYDVIKKAIGDEQDPPWKPDDFVIISLTPIE